MLAVTPCVGVWIETSRIRTYDLLITVTPCVGVWIETYLVQSSTVGTVSHPAWVCGLKLNR